MQIHTVLHIFGLGKNGGILAVQFHVHSTNVFVFVVVKS